MIKHNAFSGKWNFWIKLAFPSQHGSFFETADSDVCPTRKGWKKTGMIGSGALSKITCILRYLKGHASYRSTTALGEALRRLEEKCYFHFKCAVTGACGACFTLAPKESKRRRRRRMLESKDSQVPTNCIGTCDRWKREGDTLKIDARFSAATRRFVIPI